MSRLDQSSLDFGMTYIAATVVLIALAGLLSAVGVSMSTAAIMLPVALAAFVAGARFGERTGGRPGARQAWQFAVTATLISLTVVLVLFAGVVVMTGPLGRAAISDVILHPATIFMLISTIAVVHLLTVRFVFDAGALRGARSRRGVGAG